MNLRILDGFGRVHPNIKTLNTDAELNKGTDSKIGFSRIYDKNKPGRGNTMQGFSRVTYTNQELQGLSLQGQTILQGYQLGTVQDLEEWEYLVNIEHPTVLQGFANFVLNGRAERKARRAEKKQAKQAKSEAKTAKAQKREARRGAGKDRAQRRKEVRTAKKEEKLLKKVARREDRTGRKEAKQARKQSRIDSRLKAKELKEMTKRLKAEARGERGGRIAEMFKDVTGEILPDVLDLAKGRGDFSEMTAGDFQLPEDLDQFVTSRQGEDVEDVLDERSMILDEAEAEGMGEDAPGKPASDEADSKKKNNLPLFAGLGLLAFTMAPKGKKGKKSKK